MPADSADRQVIVDGPLFATWNRYGRDVLVVSLAGELDESNVASARRAVFDATDRGDDAGPGGLFVVDLSMLEFIDSAGIALLFSLVDYDGDGHGLRIVPSRAPGVERVLRLTGLAEHARIAREPARTA